MAIRYPVYWDHAAGTIRPMSVQGIQRMRKRVLSLHRNYKTVDIQVATGVLGGNMLTISDTRKIAGASNTDVTNFDTEAETANVTTKTINYNRLIHSPNSRSSVTDTNNRRYPLYLDGSNNLVAMNQQDMLDTFITQALDDIVDGSDHPGVYKLSTLTDVANHTIVSGTPVFTDTRANVGAYTASGIGETLDQPTTINNYYLHIGDASLTTVENHPLPLKIGADDNIETYDAAALDVTLGELLQYYGGANGGTGNQISYNWTDTGQQRGTALVNTVVNGSTYRTRFVNGNDYRAQEHPSGTVITVNTYTFSIQRS